MSLQSLLQISFPSTQQWPGWNLTSFSAENLLQKGAETCGNLELTVSDGQYSGGDVALFRAYSTKTSSSGQPKAFFLKFALQTRFIEDLIQEARVYTALETLQGSVVPRFYGLWETDDGEVACLVMEDCGDCIKQSFEELDIQTRIDIFVQLEKFHETGWHHNDFAERNVLHLETDIRLIDFDQIAQCPDDIAIRSYEPRLPNRNEVSCEWLRNIADEKLNIWSEA
ncbi:hypothetical protein C8J56DRAFT_979289 [Mycena floridula]|nr:hypothetical protein C8J56DRAFT_990707 [Mycena floridula]KAJ7574287.1 hypothetical protein C8J56DRAFT_979289 [Mycena floridula]